MLYKINVLSYDIKYNDSKEKNYGKGCTLKSKHR